MHGSAQGRVPSPTSDCAVLSFFIMALSFFSTLYDYFMFCRLFCLILLFTCAILTYHRNYVLTSTLKEFMRIQMSTLFYHQLIYAKCNYIFYQAFFYFTNFLWKKYVHQYWLPHKKRLLICVVIIINFAGLKLCITSFLYKTLAQSKKTRKVDAVTSILRKIPNSIKLEPLLRFRPN